MQNDIIPKVPNNNQLDDNVVSVETPEASEPVHPDAFAGPASESETVTSGPVFSDPIPDSSVEPVTMPQSSSMPQPDTAASVSPTDSFSPMATTSTGSGKKKSLITGILIAIVLVILGGGGAAAYNLWYQNPDKVLGDALVNAMSAKSLTFTSDMNINLKSTSEEMPSKVTVSFDGKGSYTAGSQLDVTVATKYNGKDISLSGSGIVDKDMNIYFKVDGVRKVINNVIGDATLPPAYDKLVTDLDGKWVKISADDIKSYSKEWSEMQTCVSDAFKKLQDNKSETNELVDAYKKNRFIVIKNKLGSKDGSLGYEVDVDKDKSKSFGKAMEDTQLYKDVDKCDPSGSKTDDLGSDFDSLDSESTDKTQTHVELWVSRFGHQVTKVKTTMKDDSSSATVSDAEFVFEPQMNAPVSIDAPSNTISIKDLQKDFEAAFGETYSAVQSSAVRTATANDASLVTTEIVQYQTNNQGQLPSLAQLKSQLQSEGNSGLSAKLSSVSPNAETPATIQYRICKGRDFEVNYYNTSTRQIVNANAGNGSSCTALID